MAWADRRIATAELARNWLLVFATNALGAAGMAALAVPSGYCDMNGAAVARAAVRIAAAKASPPFWTAFFAGMLCNVLVCLAIWLAIAGRTVVDKIAAIVLPIAAFVGAGFEHSVANMDFLPLGIYLRDKVDATGIRGIENLDPWAYVRNLVPVTLGNIVGGSGFVALVCFVIYRLVPRLAAARRERG